MTRLHLQAANLGYGIHNHLWGRGYATEASRAALDIAFRELGFHRVEASMIPANRASAGVARALGMRPEGVRKGYIYFSPTRADGTGWTDLMAYSLNAEDLGIRPRPPRFRVNMEALVTRPGSSRRSR
jgi:[ribosomal protein S5]-alanine N-acetyltransferase